MITKEKIDGFTGPFNFLSNFYIFPVAWKDMVLKSAEHAYQSEKPTNNLERELILNAVNPAAAKRLGSPKNCKSIRPDWEMVKRDIMTEVLMAKFSAPELRYKLLQTGNRELIERNWWGDTYWGVCNRVGENWLGKLLMKVRSVI